MPLHNRIRKKYDKPDIGDMVDRVTIHLRSIVNPNNGSVDFSEDFTPKRTLWSIVNTISGETMFDGHNVERDVTHEVLIRYFDGVTSEDWVELINGDLLDILPTEDLNQRSEYLLLKCSRRGSNQVAANEL